ncbi:phosphoribosylglycinamide formyltransferase-1 [Acetoanaerobium pronyense]|uniref:Phosphoribosylglycinamide formyltransferase n=1 Tax=Acetoanaerobium pronyense TaxID=1482736 RepID=A0ABS4KKF0_9FIRM|nr:phosphoribosylglycinamide formyltransferase [Acetoanaerobium pronyense]MBP2027109.1 phosphoribosylglycinamide formyltransferase-1 [Acetoanaerobium pronyense]
MKICVMISGSGTNLQSLIDASKEGFFRSKIELVASNKENAYGLERAKNEDIETYIIKSEEEFINKLQEKDIDLIVMAGYLKVIGTDLIEKYKGRIINIHPSLLPSYGGKGMYGLKVHEAVLRNNEKITGATVHHVTEDVDEGPVIISESIYIDYEKVKSPEDLQKEVLEIEHNILKKAIKHLEKL